MTAGDRIRQLAGGQALRRLDWFTVVGVTDDPTTVIVTDGDSRLTATCLGGYNNRAAGDRVLAVQLTGGEWTILGKVAADTAPPDAPPAGAVTVPSVSAGGWRSTTATDNPVIGSVDGADDATGAWFWGGSVAAACAGRTVTAMTLRISRLYDDGGPDGPVIVRPGLHNDPYRRRPTITDTWQQTQSIDQGQALALPIPAAQRAQLANGTAAGIVLTGSGPDEQAAFTAAAVITVQFAA